MFVNKEKISMKKIISIVLSFVVLASMLSFGSLASAHEPNSQQESGGNYRLLFNGARAVEAQYCVYAKNRAGKRVCLAHDRRISMFLDCEVHINPQEYSDVYVEIEYMTLLFQWKNIYRDYNYTGENTTYTVEGNASPVVDPKVIVSRG